MERAEPSKRARSPLATTPPSTTTQLHALTSSSSSSNEQQQQQVFASSVVVAAAAAAAAKSTPQRSISSPHAAVRHRLHRQSISVSLASSSTTTTAAVAALQQQQPPPSIVAASQIQQIVQQRYIVSSTHSHRHDGSHRHSPERIIAGKKVPVPPQRKYSQQHFHHFHPSSLTASSNSYRERYTLQQHVQQQQQQQQRTTVTSASAAVAAAILFRRQHSVGQLHLIGEAETSSENQRQLEEEAARNIAAQSAVQGGAIAVQPQHHHSYSDRFSEAMFRRLSLGNILPAARRRASQDKQRRKNSLQIWQPSACFNHMMKGSQLLKVRSGSRIYSRFFTLDADLSAIRWTPTAKKNLDKAKIPVSTIKEVRVGKCTENLRNPALTSQYADECAFAIVHGEQFETLDLIAPSPDEANIWVTGLMSLIGSLLNQVLNAAASNASLQSGGGELSGASGGLPTTTGGSFSVAASSAAPGVANIGSSLAAFISRGADLRDRWLAQQFREFDTDHDGLLAEHQVLQLCVKLEPNLFHALNRIQQKIRELIAFNRSQRPVTGGTSAAAKSQQYYVPSSSSSAVASLNMPLDSAVPTTTTSTDDAANTTNVTTAVEEYFDAPAFADIFKDVSTRPEIYHLLVRFANKEYMSCDDLILFLEAEQGMQGSTRAECGRLIDEHEPFDEARAHGILGVDGFTRFLLSPQCDIFDRQHEQVCQDMSQPLQNYYIAASHNTYLIEDQLKGPTSIDGYIWALKKGCRSIEIDVWDGTPISTAAGTHGGAAQPSTPRSTSSSAHGDSPLGLGNFAAVSSAAAAAESSTTSRLSPGAVPQRPVPEPMVYHGHTLTSKLPFRAIVEAINEFAFVSTPYPLLIKLEVHCSLLQQYVLVDILRSILGDRLLTVDDFETANPGQPMKAMLESLSTLLPSPEQLRYKIIIVSKRLPLERYYTTTAVQRRELHAAATAGNTEVDNNNVKLPSAPATSAASVIVNKRGVPVRTLAPLRLLGEPTTSSTLNSDENAMTNNVNNTSGLVAGEVSEEDEAAESNRQRRFSAQASTSFIVAAAAAAAAAGGTAQPPAPNSSNNSSPSAATGGSGSAASAIAMFANNYSPTLCNRMACNASTTSSAEAESAGQQTQQQPSGVVSAAEPTSIATTGAAGIVSSPIRSASATPTNIRRGSSVRKIKLTKAVSDLVTYLETIPLRAIAELAQTQKAYQLASFSEAYAAKLVNSSPAEFAQYTVRFLTRTYPNGMRVDSSNFNPQDMWNCGCQIVSLNYQTPGLMMDLNDARFTINGNCGYVLKPQAMRIQHNPSPVTTSNDAADQVDNAAGQPPGQVDQMSAEFAVMNGAKQQRTNSVIRQSFVLPFAAGQSFGSAVVAPPTAGSGGGGGPLLDATSPYAVAVAAAAAGSNAVVVPQVLRVKIISALNLPKPRGSGSKGDVIDPYVTIELFGVPADCGEERTKTVQNNGYNPIFDESFEFHVTMPELCLVRFVVLDDDHIGDDFIGQYTLPFECLQTGYRHVRLKNFQGEPIDGCLLFVHVAVTNRRGGGKPTKRGMSVRLPMRKRKQRSVGLKLIGIKPVDDLFKERAYSLMKEAIDLRDTVEAALNTFKEECGLQSMSNLKQCMRLLAARIATASVEHRMVIKIEPSVQQQQQQQLPAAARLSSRTVPFAVENNGKNAGDATATTSPLQQKIGGASEVISIPRLVFDGKADSESVPDILKRGYTSYQNMVDKCQHMISQAEPLRRRFLAAHTYIMDLYGSSEELSRVCASFGIKQGTKKWTKAVDAFAWNMRLLTGQADVLQQAREECKLNLKQICEAAAATGLLVSSPPPQTHVPFSSSGVDSRSGSADNTNAETLLLLLGKTGENVNGNLNTSTAANKVVVDI